MEALKYLEDSTTREQVVSLISKYINEEVETKIRKALEPYKLKLSYFERRNKILKSKVEDSKNSEMLKKKYDKDLKKYRKEISDLLSERQELLQQKEFYRNEYKRVYNQIAK